MDAILANARTGAGDEDAALGELLRRLKAMDYRFTTVTPATHRLVLSRPPQGPPTLRDIFGWSRSFQPADLDSGLLDCLERAGALAETGGELSSKVRVASLGSDLFLHSSFPTVETDAVFFGPDTYRFAAFIADALPQLPPPMSVIDMGTGSGAGGLICARLAPQARVRLVDVNAQALRFARINAEVAGLEATFAQVSEVPPGADLILANPPYIIDPLGRAYRDGGDLLGGEIALTWVGQALDGLEAGGTMLLYFGAAFQDGRAPALDAIASECGSRRASLSVREIDPDVFGEELENSAYADVERIAAVGCVIRSGG